MPRRAEALPVKLLSVVLAALCFTSPLVAQTRIPAPAAADSLWQVIRACSGAPVTTGGDLKDVVWMVDSVTAKSRFRTIIAMWTPPDTITIDVDVDYVDNPWVVAHELLHHLLRGPPGTVAHPFQPFYWPCKLMPQYHGISQALPGQRGFTLVETKP
jgi:hypothetical protein